MNRFQTLLLAIWAVLLTLFVAFNWQLMGTEVMVAYLFMEFNIRLYMWLVVVAFGVPVLLRLLSGLDTRTRKKRSDRELHLIKSKAFDGLTGEFDKMLRQLQDQLDGRIRSMLAEHGAISGKSTDAETPQPEEEEEKEASDSDDEVPKLSVETAATLSEIDKSTGKDDPGKSKARSKAAAK
ncbi:MAG: hypothetical protein O7G32_09685 [SAR324 cluster bacterium]|nr:hypothetical protein [SAR324 cluster bacterium]